jgi:hypothetical protein
MALKLDAAEIAAIETNVAACEADAANLNWFFETNNLDVGYYIGYLDSPYDTGNLRLVIGIPYTSTTTPDFTTATFEWKKDTNLTLPLPEPDSVTKGAWTTFAEVLAWVIAVIDEQT